MDLQMEPLLANNHVIKSVENDGIPFNIDVFNEEYEYIKKPHIGFKERIKTTCTNFSIVNLMLTIFPIYSWIQEYKSQYFVKDFISGATVAILHIPQGLAYATLGGVDPIVGIYMAFFPVIVYVLMGTSRHISTGTFAVVCIMASKPVLSLSKDGGADFVEENDYYITPLYVATALTFSVGIWQVLLGILRLGSVSVLLSDTLVSSFTTGAACLVFTSQIKHVVGIKLPRHTGPLKPILSIIDVAAAIKNINIVPLCTSLVIIIVLLCFNSYFKEKVTRALKAPLPVEFLLIVFGTVLTAVFKLDENSGVSVVGSIPVGFPTFTPPAVWMFRYVWLDGLIIAIVSFSVNYSMGSIFARQENYKVDPNQELIASGCGNIFGSFFSCLPFSASLSRSVIQKSVGGVTQVASAVSSILLLSVILYFGQYFEKLPNCVLAGIIIANLKTMFIQFADLKKTWKKSHIDGSIWVITFLSVVLLDIDIGLGIGLGMSVVYLIFIGQDIKISILGKVSHHDTFVDLECYHKAIPISHTMIINLTGGFHFGNYQKVIEKITHMIKINEQKKLHKVILDMSGVCFVDPASANGLKTFQEEILGSYRIKLLLANINVSVYEALIKYQYITEKNEDFIFPTIHDAVLFTVSEIKNEIQDSLPIKPVISKEKMSAEFIIK